MPRQQKKREKLLKKCLAMRTKITISRHHANRGRKHVRLGKNAYINFFFTAVDDTHFYIGDHTMIAPGVRVAVPIRTRSNAQKTHTCFVKAAYNMSCIISPLFLVFAHFFAHLN